MAIEWACSGRRDGAAEGTECVVTLGMEGTSERRPEGEGGSWVSSQAEGKARHRLSSGTPWRVRETAGGRAGWSRVEATRRE